MSQRANRIRAEAEKQRAIMESQGAARVDALAHEVGFLMGFIEGLCVELDSYAGVNAKAARGCQIAEVHDAIGSFTVEVEYRKGQAGKFSGPPEDCYETLPSELDIVQVWINGEWVDPRDLIHPDVLNRWADTLCAEFDEHGV